MIQRGERETRLANAMATLTACVAVALLVGGPGDADAGTSPTLRGAPLLAQISLPQVSGSLEQVTARLLPSVVQIVVSGIEPVVPGTTGSPLLNRRQSGGSGVIVDSSGYIVTNAHVVEGARRVQVRLASVIGGDTGSSILKPAGELLPATVVGTDRETDIAVLQIARQGLPAVELGDSDTVRPGMLVLAFGSPFGLENSVSLGVVSAEARQLQPEAPMIYIQTDAPINPGNSGGPLVDIEGRVMGINTLIFSQSGGSEGIGFAAPSNIVRFVYEEIRAHRRVRRGVIGVGTQTISPLMARALELPQDWGVIVSDVYPRGPASAAGLQVGDLILSLGGKRMENARQFDVNLYREPIGSEVEVEVLRDGQTLSLTATVVERTEGANPFAAMVSDEHNLVPALGLLCIDIDDEVRQFLPEMRISSGVLVAAREQNAGPGASFMPGDVIHSINRTPITSLSQLKQELAKYPPFAAVAAQVERAGQLVFVVFEIE